MNESPSILRRTQFDAQRLNESIADGPPIGRNHGRQQAVLEDGSVLTALAWAGESSVLRIWRNLELLAEHALTGEPSCPCLVPQTPGEVHLWMSVDGEVFHSTDLRKPPVRVEGLAGVVEDAA